MIVAGYNFIVFRHTTFLLATLFAFGGLWLTLRNRKLGGFLLACCLLIYPLPYYLVNPFPRYKHAIEPEMVLLAVYLFWEASRNQVRWRRKNVGTKLPIDATLPLAARKKLRLT